MAEKSKVIKLEGRLTFRFYIEAVTGLHIGGTNANIEIGGVDKSVIRNPIDNRPYIPGSSLKGKMRSLLEKYGGLAQNQRIGLGFIHSCDDNIPYQDCAVCQVFGVPGERKFGTPTRIIVRDTLLGDKEAQRIRDTARTDLPYTEIKTEVSIDRVTSAANPRQMERVVAGTRFGPGEIVYSFYSGDDCDLERDIRNLGTLVRGMQLLEDDYLGGLGARGSGRIAFRDFALRLRAGDDYAERPLASNTFQGLAELRAGLNGLLQDVRAALGA